jgi:acetyl-CoA synthetase
MTNSHATRSGLTPAVERAQYLNVCRSACEDPEAFWGEVGRRLDWVKPYTKVRDVCFRPEDFHIRWYEDGELNVSANCLDRHLRERRDRPAIIWEGDDPARSITLTYGQLHGRVCRFANALRGLGVARGDRVIIYLPMIPEAAIAMLACARIGAVHSVVFAGFSPEALANRIADCAAKVVITADQGVRGGKPVPLKQNVATAFRVHDLPSVQAVVVVRHTGAQTPATGVPEFAYEALLVESAPECDPAPLSAEHPLFILYTSGSTGKPKGVLHTSGGYLVYAAYTLQTVFDLREDDVFWCTADVGWITGHSYCVYGPLACGATVVMFEGVPNYPDPGRFWQVCDKHGVTVFYSSPTAIRALIREGDRWVTRSSRRTLRLLGSVGEPINPGAWEWYHQVVGEQRCPIVDTWWQTETGGILIAPIPGITELEPGSATLPLPGIVPLLVDNEGRVLEGEAEGNLVLAASWPGQMRSVYGNHERFVDTYFRTFPGYYNSGDGARRDSRGYFWITGRVDDVINVSGHRLGTVEIEGALLTHEAVAEAAVVGCPHDLKGQAVYAFVTLKAGISPTEALRLELRNVVRAQIGPIATPEVVQWAPALPKTRSGKIMRRVLRKIASDEAEQIGDVSTLADPSVVSRLIEGHLAASGRPAAATSPPPPHRS